MKHKIFRYLAPLAVVALLGCQSRPPGTPETSTAEPADSAAAETRSVGRPAPERILEIPAGWCGVLPDHSVGTEQHQSGDAFTATLDEPVMAGNRWRFREGHRSRAK
jgi:hypothetical protein